MDPVDLTVVRGEKKAKERCEFCGKAKHAGDYECPRIEYVTQVWADGSSTEVHFWPDEASDVPPRPDDAA